MQFHNAFKRTAADVVHHYRHKYLREAAQLGSPPAIFTTNSSESINSAIKKQVSYKKTYSGQSLYSGMKSFVLYLEGVVTYENRHRVNAKYLIGKHQEVVVGDEVVVKLNSWRYCTTVVDLLDWAPPQRKQKAVKKKAPTEN